MTVARLFLLAVSVGVTALLLDGEQEGDESVLQLFVIVILIPKSQLCDQQL